MIDCPQVIVVDGDSLQCGRERLRLLGIDTPELDDCYPKGRHCVAGDGAASKQALRRGMTLGPVRYERVGTDRYGRSLVVAWAGSTVLNCYAMQYGGAAYVERWDIGGRVARLSGNSMNLVGGDNGD